MKKPVGIIIVIVMNALKLAITLLPLLLCAIISALPETNELRQGFEMGLGGTITAGVLGEMFGRTAIYAAVMIVLFVGIFQRNFVLTLVTLILHALLSINSIFGFIWAVAMLLIVVLSKKNRAYLKKLEG